MNFKDKVVLITGASSGIGRESAIEFAKLAWNKEGKEDNAPNLTQLATYFNKGATFVQHTILSTPENALQRAKILEFYIDLLDIMIQRRDYQTE